MGRGYRGRPENQRNPATRNLAFPAPTPAQAHGKRSMFEDSIFQTNISVREHSGHVTFTPNLAALVHISRATFTEMLRNDPNLAKSLTPETFDYYCTFLLWMRIIHLQIRNGHPVTQTMRAIAQDLLGVTFSVPEPIFIFLKGIGNVVTAAGQHLYPTFPDMPDQILAGRGGYFGPLDVLTIARYLDVPCLGVLSEAVCQSTSAAAVGAYVSEVAPVGLNAALANSNLPGFFPLGHRREEAKNIALAAEITPLAFPSDYPGFGLNTRFAMSVSSVVANTRTFSVSTISFASLSEQGSTAQLIKLNPLVIDDPTTPVYDMEARPTTTIRESPAIFGAASFTQYCLFREPNAQPHPHNVWSPLTHTDDDPINPSWLPFRNLRRDIPEYIQADVFTSVSQKSREYRQTVVRLMVKSTH